ncbi:MAG: hypothetical protein NC218_04075 [Acetobacter sp.]|nr:hypothetical protein [Acetobacter sp.]
MILLAGFVLALPFIILGEIAEENEKNKREERNEDGKETQEPVEQSQDILCKEEDVKSSKQALKVQAIISDLESIQQDLKRLYKLSS